MKINFFHNYNVLKYNSLYKIFNIDKMFHVQIITFLINIELIIRVENYVWFPLI